MSKEILVDEILSQAIKSVNEIFSPDQGISLDDDTTLIGMDSDIESLVLINLLLEVEKLVKRKFEKSIDLMGEISIEDGDSINTRQLKAKIVKLIAS